MSVPSQVKEELLKQCPDGIFARMNNQFEKLSPEERKAFVSELYGNAKNKPQGQINETSPGVSSMSTRSEPSTETRDPLFLGSSGSTGSPPAQQPARDSQSTFSYAEQRSKYSNTETGIPQPPPSSRQPEFSYAQQRALNSGGSIQPVPTIQQDTQPPQPTGLSNPPAGTGKKVKRNIYGDEMD
ncbi:probable serine/threonine-protein kinase samkC [Mercenaria mercenaria]|uniref:probable serine/threonine-protein kinase samkC n=1 Tax=Mercenaria mercenaria TaxID=6596 RepID=UPI00234E6CF3|nr:probable serine/threonine-protein kinase samkC [Mercenaria mercenaria]